jgi:hypothetical protein
VQDAVIKMLRWGDAMLDEKGPAQSCWWLIILTGYDNKEVALNMPV